MRVKRKSWAGTRHIYKHKVFNQWCFHTLEISVYFIGIVKNGPKQRQEKGIQQFSVENKIRRYAWKKSWILFTIDEVLRKSLGCLFKNNLTQTWPKKPVDYVRPCGVGSMIKSRRKPLFSTSIQFFFSIFEWTIMIG